MAISSGSQRGILKRESSASGHGRSRKLSFSEETPRPIPLRAEGWKEAQIASQRVGNISMQSMLIAEQAQNGSETAKAHYVQAREALEIAKQEYNTKKEQYHQAEAEWTLARVTEEENADAIKAFSHTQHAPYARRCAIGASKLMNKLVLCDLEPEIKEKLQDHTLKIIENSHTFDSFDRNIMMIATKTMDAAIEKKQSDPAWDIDDFIGKKASVFEPLYHIIPKDKPTTSEEKTATLCEHSAPSHDNPFKVIFDLLKGVCGKDKKPDRSVTPLSPEERQAQQEKLREERCIKTAKRLMQDIITSDLPAETKEHLDGLAFKIFEQSVEDNKDSFKFALLEIATDTMRLAMNKKRSDPAWDIDSFLDERKDTLELLY